MPARDVVFPTHRHALYEAHRYSPAVRANGLLFVSGQVGARPDGSPEPDRDEQVRLAFRNLDAVLAAAGCSFADVVDVTVFMLNPDEHFERAWAVAAEFWGERWNRTVGEWLYRFAFRPLARRRRPMLGLAAAFALSALLHAWMFVVALDVRAGFMAGAFFLVQGERLDAAQVNPVLQKNGGKLAACLSSTRTRQASIDLIILGSGKVSAVRVNGETGTELAACVRRVLGAAQFPTFRGNRSKFNFDIDL